MRSFFCTPLSAMRTQGMVTLSPTPFFHQKLWFPIRFLLMETDGSVEQARGMKGRVVAVEVRSGQTSRQIGEKVDLSALLRKKTHAQLEIIFISGITTWRKCAVNPETLTLLPRFTFCNEHRIQRLFAMNMLNGSITEDSPTTERWSISFSHYISFMSHHPCSVFDEPGWFYFMQVHMTRHNSAQVCFTSW